MNNKKKYLSLCLILICGLFIFGCSSCTNSTKNDDFSGGTFAGMVLYDAVNNTVNVPETDVAYKVNLKGQGRVIKNKKFEDRLVYVEGVVKDNTITINHLEEVEKD